MFRACQSDENDSLLSITYGMNPVATSSVPYRAKWPSRTALSNGSRLRRVSQAGLLTSAPRALAPGRLRIRERRNQSDYAILLRGRQAGIERQAEDAVGIAARIGRRPRRLAEGAHRRLLRDERAVVDERFHAVLAQMAFQRVALVGAEHVGLVDAMLAGPFDRYVAEGRKKFMVAPRDAAARLGLRVELAQVHAQQRRLQLVQARVVAERLATLAIGEAMAARLPELVRQRRVVGGNDAAVAVGIQVLQRVEAEAG